MGKIPEQSTPHSLIKPTEHQHRHPLSLSLYAGVIKMLPNVLKHYIIESAKSNNYTLIMLVLSSYLLLASIPLT